MIDILQEIYSTIRMNKMRTFLTGFAVAWGIFILIVLLGSGNGILNAFEESANRTNIRTITLYPSFTNVPHGGFQRGRAIKLDETDITVLNSELNDYLSSESGLIDQSNITFKNDDHIITGQLKGVSTGYQKNAAIEIILGRFINQDDLKEKRRTLVIHEKAIPLLFGKEIDPIGKSINVNKLNFLIVGVYKDKGFNNYRDFYCPIATVKQIYNADKFANVSFISKNINSLEKSEKLTNDIREVLARKKIYSPNDKGAIWISNQFTFFLQQQSASGYLRIAIWVIGIFTLLSGIVGVSNIMLISVKERTREFGIRKAIGAKPNSILRLILVESVIITTFFGYIGMFAGVLATEWMNYKAGNKVLDAGVFSQTVFSNPTVDINIAIQATLTLIIAGTIAGFIPARKAVSVKPIEALNAR